MYLMIGDIGHAEEYLKVAKENVYQNKEKEKMETMIAETEARIAEGKKHGRFYLDKLYVMK